MKLPAPEGDRYCVKITAVHLETLVYKYSYHIIRDNQRAETTQMFINGWINTRCTTIKWNIIQPLKRKKYYRCFHMDEP